MPADLEPIRQEAKAHFYRCFEEALAAIDLPDGGPPVDLGSESAVSAGAGAPRAGGVRRARRGGDTLRAVLRPAKPLLQTLAGPMLPLLGRAARVVASLRR